MKLKKIVLIFTLILLLCMVTTPVYARYLSSVRDENENLEIDANVQVLMMNTSDDFVEMANGKQFSFTLTNANSQGEIAKEEQICKVWVMGSLGLTEKANITMTVDGETFTGIPELIDETNNEFGLGYIYKFYDDEQEINFILPANITTSEIIVIDIENPLEDALIEVKIVQD